MASPTTTRQGSLFRTKSVEQSIADTDEPDSKLRRELGALDLTVFGVAVLIGAGIFTITARTAGDVTGPAIAVSFVIAAIACGFAGLCYAEFASTVPVAGSAYTFSYATFGEFIAWIIGWDLILEYALGAATVAKSWSSYLGKITRHPRAGRQHVVHRGRGRGRLGRDPRHRGAHRRARPRHQALQPGVHDHHLDQAPRRPLRDHPRGDVHQGGQLHAPSSRRPSRRRRVRAGSSPRCSPCSSAARAAPTAASACWPARRWCSSRSSGSTPSRRRPRRPRTRRRTSRAASSARSPWSPCSTSRRRSCSSGWSTTPSSRARPTARTRRSPTRSPWSGRTGPRRSSRSGRWPASPPWCWCSCSARAACSTR